MNSLEKFLLRNTYDLDPHFGVSSAHLITVVGGIVMLIAAIIVVWAISTLIRNTHRETPVNDSTSRLSIILAFVAVFIIATIFNHATNTTQAKTYHFKSGYVKEIKLEQLSNDKTEYVYKAYKYNFHDDGFASVKLTSKHISKQRVIPTDKLVNEGR